MSQRIVIHRWAGKDRENITGRLAKVFRLSHERSTDAMRQITEGHSWKFEQNIPEEQIEQAQTYLRNLGFDLEWIPVQDAPPVEKSLTKTPEELLPPSEAPQPKSWLDKLKGITLSKPKKPPPAETSLPALKHPPALQPSAKKTSPLVKLFCFLIIFLLAGVAALPYWTGMQAELKFNEWPAKVYDSRGIILINKGFQKGWLRSSAENLLKVSIFKFKLIHEIMHGPILYEEIIKRNYPNALAQAQIHTRVTAEDDPDGASSGFLPVEADTTIHLDGHSEIHFKMLPYINTPNQPTQINWQGLKGEALFSADSADIQGSLTTQPLQVIQGKKILSINQAKTDLTLQKTAAGVIHRTATLKIDEIFIKDNKETYPLEGLDLYFSDQEAAGLLNLTAKLQVESVEFGKARYGPGSVTFKIRRLDADGLGKMQQHFLGSLEKSAKAPNPVEQLTLLGLVDALLKKSPQLEISQLTLKTPEGRIDGHGKISFDTGILDLKSNPFSIFQAVNAEAGLAIPVATLRKTLAMLPADQWEQSGFLEKKGKDYKTTITFKSGKLAINGNTLRLSASKVNPSPDLPRKK